MAPITKCCSLGVFCPDAFRHRPWCPFVHAVPGPTSQPFARRALEVVDDERGTYLRLYADLVARFRTAFAADERAAVARFADHRLTEHLPSLDDVGKCRDRLCALVALRKMCLDDKVRARAALRHLFAHDANRDKLVSGNVQVLTRHAVELARLWDALPPVVPPAATTKKGVVVDDPRFVPYVPPDEKDRECVVCMDAPREYAFCPCGHYLLCAACNAATTHPTCPKCATPVESTLRITVPARWWYDEARHEARRLFP